jgi:hypothetical protein
MRSRITGADILLALVVATVGLYLAAADRPEVAGERLIIRAPGRAPMVLDLDEERVVEVEGLRGTTTVMVGGGRAAFVSSACPNKVCIRRGEISRCGEWIACVPNGVTATVIGEAPYDGVTP